MAVCDTCSTGWYGQTCNPQFNARDFTDCWPPRSGEQKTSDPGVMMGWGFYSPGIVCPAGYTTAAMATAGGSSGWSVEFSMTDGETAAACCPRFVPPFCLWETRSSCGVAPPSLSRRLLRTVRS